MAATSFMRTWQDFDLIQLVILPMFLFSGTFYPVETYPAGAADRRPADAALPGRRPAALARGRASSGRTTCFHVVYLAVDGDRRAARRVAAARPAAAQVAWPPAAERRAALAALTAEIVACRLCPRLVEWREQVAREKVARFRDETYWGRPVPGFGDPDARILLVGLAPAAHGGNRTGRVFTGDASGDFLFAAMHAVGLANQATSRSADDGLELTRRVHRRRRPVRAAGEQAAAVGARQLRAVPRPRARAALGRAGARRARGVRLGGGAAGGRRRRRRGRGAAATAEVRARRGGAVGPYTLIGTYHPSQQNTFTGRLTAPMLQDVLERASELAGVRT